MLETSMPAHGFAVAIAPPSAQAAAGLLLHVYANLDGFNAGTMPPARSILPYKKPNYTVQLAPHEIVVCPSSV